MKKFYFLAALVAGTALTSCTSEDDLALSPPEVNNVEDGNAPIMFSSLKNNFTRADIKDAEAAKLLGNKFVVMGFKGDATTQPGSVVFDNYFVEYEPNTAYTTESNTDNWEYVSKTPIAWATANGITQQSIKYWDYSKTQYDFLAWSTGANVEAIYSGDYANGEVLVTNIQPNSKEKNWRTENATTGDPERMAYTFSGTSDDLSQCYISNLVTVYKKGKADKAIGDNEATYNVIWEGYKDPVTLTFRQLGTKVRIGFYETIPGYSVKNVKFYTKGGLLTPDANDATKPEDGQIVPYAVIFSAGADIYKEGTYKVYFPTVDQPTKVDNNQAHIKFTPKPGATQETTVSWGELDYTFRESGEKDNGAVYLGRTSNTATFANKAKVDEHYYEIYLPNEEGANLNLRVNYTLESIDGSGETIEVKNAKAQVPSIYTKWQPGYAYTYLFKISDNTNGRTGVYDPTKDDNATINSDPAGLYPITFDAVVVNAEDVNQETITSVSTPSITTYQKGSTVIDNDEYLADPGDIFVTVNSNVVPNPKPDNYDPKTEIVALKDGDNVKAALYTITEGMTEADVIDVLTYQDNDFDPALATNTIKGRDKNRVLVAAEQVTSKDDLEAGKWMLTNAVEYGVDGNVIEVATDKVLRFTPAAPVSPATVNTYAFVYTESTEEAKDYYEACPWNKFDENEVKYRYAYKATTKSHTVGSTDYYDAQKGHVYFSTNGTTYSRVNKPFIGQGAGNLFTRSGDAAPYTYTKATTDNAVSGTTYYYTTDGQTYPEAHTVTYNTPITNVLYEYDTTNDNYVLTSDPSPVDGKAYYFLDSGKYIYCVFMPQQVNGMYELNTEAAKVVADEAAAVEGMTYFDKYTKIAGKRYVKVIKIAATPTTQDPDPTPAPTPEP